jgi:hypothetical protein
MEISLFDRDTLHNRHRLSHQQIDKMLEESQDQLVLDEKISQLSLLPEFLGIAGSLRQAGIWFVPLKGPLLSWRIYGDATCRQFIDFDFLVRPESLDQSINMLLQSGYQPISFEWPMNGRRYSLALSKLHHFGFYHPKKYISVEMHWKLFVFPVTSFERIAKLADDNILQIIFSGQNFNQFTAEFELVYLVIHGGLHGWVRLKWLTDVHEIVNRSVLDKEKFDSLVKQLNAQRMVGLCNAMLHHFFPGSALPANYSFPGWLYRFSFQQATSDTADTFRPVLNYKLVWFLMQAFPDWNYKLRVLDMHTFYAQHLGNKRIPPFSVFFKIYYLTKVIYSLMRYPFKHLNK